MKHLFIFAYLILPACLFAQIKIDYSIDLIRTDSFFLKEKIVSKDKTRPDTLNSYTLFRDTAAFVQYIAQRAQDADNARIQAEYFKAAQDSLSERVKRLEKLAKDVFGIKLKPDKREVVAEILEVEALPAGFWVIYPYRGRASAEYITDLAQIKKDALILNNNGTTFYFEMPKKPIRATKKQ